MVEKKNWEFDFSDVELDSEPFDFSVFPTEEQNQGDSDDD